MSATMQRSTTTVEPCDAAARAQAYVALLGYVVPELDPEALGRAVKKWATFMAVSSIPQDACIRTLRMFREECPVIALAQACDTLSIDAREVLAFEVSA